jgi:UDP-3-O-[3-hydroxymyristoyl] glucosamine N-acyltransferase
MRRRFRSPGLVERVAEIDPAAHVSPGAIVGEKVSVGPGTVVYAGAEIGPGTAIGAGTVIHAGVRIGPGCMIEDCVVLGKRPRLRAGSSATGLEPGPLLLGDQVTVCAGAVLYAGAEIGGGAIVGDQSQVRERSRVGARTVVGRASCVDFDAVVGDRVSIQTGVYVTSGATVEDDVFLGPAVVMTNDDTMGRHSRGEGLSGPILRRACRIGGGAILVPGVEVGEEAFVAAGAVVTRDVEPRAFVVGVPARVVRQVRDEELLERWR